MRAIIYYNDREEILEGEHIEVCKYKNNMQVQINGFMYVCFEIDFVKKIVIEV